MFCLGQLVFRGVVVASMFAVPASASPRARPALDGAWAGSASQCGETFIRTRKGFSFKNRRTSHGVIFQGKKVATPQADCIVRGRKRDGGIIALSLSCTTTIATSDTSARVRLNDDGTLSRLFSNIPGMETQYERCKM
jgi:hypothetical protein